MNFESISRRRLLKNLAVASVAWPLLRDPLQADEKDSMSPAGTPTGSASAPTDSPSAQGLKMGVASISLHALSLEAAIAALQRLNLKYISLYKTHAPWGLEVEKCRAAGEKVRAAGLHLMATGVVTLPNNEAVVRKAFDCARAAQLPVITCRPEADAFPLLDRFVKEYDLKLAIHNHGPEDKLYPSPFEAWKLIENFDPRIGLCMDVGHATRAGINVLDAIRRCAPRLYDFHIKDTVAQVGAPDIPVEIGRGSIDIPAILQALMEINYAYQVGVEYEVEGPGKEDPVPGVAEGVGYLRGVLKMLNTHRLLKVAAH